MGDFQKEPTPRRSAARTLSTRRLRWAFRVAFAGIAAVWRSEGNFRIQVVVGSLALLTGILLQVDVIPILLVSALVLSLELINSALEAALDLLYPEPHPLVKRAKDAAAGAVLLAALVSVVVGLWVLGPPLWRALTGWVL